MAFQISVEPLADLKVIKKCPFHSLRLIIYFGFSNNGTRLGLNIEPSTGPKIKISSKKVELAQLLIFTVYIYI